MRGERVLLRPLAEPDTPRIAEILAVAADRHGRGIATDALIALARHLVDDPGHHRLVIDPTAANARAIAAYEKIGLRPVGSMRRAERGPDGEWRDCLLMDMLAEEVPG